MATFSQSLADSVVAGGSLRAGHAGATLTIGIPDIIDFAYGIPYMLGAHVPLTVVQRAAVDVFPSMLMT